jgi:hypothetical protein
MSSTPRAVGGLVDSPRPVPAERRPRCTIGLRHYRRATTYAPSLRGTAGALDIYLEGNHDGDVLRMLFGLSVLRNATAEQVEWAIAARGAMDDPSASTIRAMLADGFVPSRDPTFMNEYIPTPRAPRTLDRYGAASRCLLRLWENQGHLSPPDGEFLRRFETRFPHWETRPGELDANSLGIVARELGLAAETTITRDYDAVLLAHRYGHAVIIATDCAPVQQAQSPDCHPHSMILEQIDEDGFETWCPFESGASDLLPRADREWWNRWNATAFVLHAEHALTNV